ncbi:MAG: hypothetical protein H7Z16_14420 [Pyrinomonadaceae bacterium]|nr:hypothetical protein [Pyrinomonadaceae bacterium]
MFATSIIEVGIGLVFVYLLMSLICSAANEIIESFLKNRATDLERGIRELFNQTDGGDLVAKFYNHPLINGLFPGKYGHSNNGAVGFRDYLKSTNLPSYIPARNFAYAIIDIALHPPAEAKTDPARDDANAAGVRVSAIDSAVLPVSMDAVRSALRENLGNKQAGRALRALAEQSGADVNALRANVESWFNGSMDRVSGAYTRRVKWIIFALGFTLTVLLNVNTITIARRLSTDATLRSVMVAQAEGRVNRADAQNADFEKNRKDLEGLGLPIGWPNGIDFINPLKNENYNTWSHFLLPLLGWLLTASAISLGAPFWFDLLNKFLVIRATVKPHEKSMEEGSEDRQPNRNLTLATAGAPSPSVPMSGFGMVSDPGLASASRTLPEPPAIPEPDFNAPPDAVDNESFLDEGDDPIDDVTPDEDLPPTKGGVG